MWPDPPSPPSGGAPKGRRRWRVHAGRAGYLPTCCRPPASPGLGCRILRRASPSPPRHQRPARSRDKHQPLLRLVLLMRAAASAQRCCPPGSGSWPWPDWRRLAARRGALPWKWPACRVGTEVASCVATECKSQYDVQPVATLPALPPEPCWVATSHGAGVEMSYRPHTPSQTSASLLSGAKRVARFSAGVGDGRGGPAGTPAGPPAGHGRLLLGEEHVGVGAPVRVHEIGHRVTVVTPGEVLP